MNMQAGDGSNAPVGAVNEILKQHFGEEDAGETPQLEGEGENLEALEQEGYSDLEGENLEGEEEQIPEGEEGAEGVVETLAELAEALGVDPTELYDLKYDMPDGMEPATLSQMKDAYVELQRTGGNNPDRAALEQDRQQFEEEKRWVQATMQQQLQVPQQLQSIDFNLHTVVQALQNTDWAKLEQVDPGDAALQRQKLNEGLMGQRQQIAGELQRQAQIEFDEFHGKQREKLYEDHPEWKANPATFKAAFDSIVEYGNRYGMTEQEMLNIPDSRIVNMLFDAAQVIKKRENTNLKGKRIQRKSGPVLKAGAVRSASSGNRKKLNEIIKRGRDSSDIRDQTNAVSAILNQRG
jgi:hypothetical protein